MESLETFAHANTVRKIAKLGQDSRIDTSGGGLELSAAASTLAVQKKSVSAAAAAWDILAAAGVTPEAAARTRTVRAPLALELVGPAPE